MHLVKEGFLHEVMSLNDAGELEEKDWWWYYGYAMGLLQAGYLTQDEHDEISNEMAKEAK